MSDNETVTVSIKAKRVVYFSQEIKMPKFQYDKLQHLQGDDVGERDQAALFILLDAHLDPRNIMDADSEFLNVEVSKAD